MDTESAEARLGQTIDRYRLEQVLGAGGFGAVYRARHVVMDRPVALKLLHIILGRSDAVRERFLREAQTLARLRHPNVVGVHDCGITSDGEVFLAMELLAGEDLAARLNRVGRLGAEDTLAIVDAVLDGLSAAHAEGIVHRDLKPANVFLAREGAIERPKLVDFGISKQGDRERLTRTGALLGTPVYMAPETFTHGTASVDARADLYAVGVMLFEMLSGRLPYDAPSYEGLVVKMATESPPSLTTVADVPTALAAVVDRALCRDPNGRFADAAEMRAALARATSSERERSSIAHAGTLAAPSMRPEAAAWSTPTTPAMSAAPMGAAPMGAPPTSTGPMAAPSWSAPSAPSPSRPSPSWPSASSSTPSHAPSGQATAPAPTPVSLPPRPVAAENRTPWGWIALALLIPSVLLGTVGIFVTTCQGKPEATALVASPSLPSALPPTPPPATTAPATTAPATTAPATTPPATTAPGIAAPRNAEPDKPPLEPVLVEEALAEGGPQPAHPPAARIEAPPTQPVAATPIMEPAPTMETLRGPEIRLRAPRVVSRDVSTEAVYALFAARRAALQRCREDEDAVAHVSLHVANGRIGLARSNPNVAGSDTEAARCVAGVLREGPAPSGHGILMLDVELPAR